MATLLFFHAHPDDEALSTGGTMAAAAAAGHRVVVVFATSGERGEVPPDLDGHASLGELRATEARRAGEVLDTARVAFLGYRDSGEDGAEADPESFAAADPVEAAARLANLLSEEAADVLTIYDPTGVTGHPDHLQVHRVGLLAAQSVPHPLEVYEATLAASQIGRIVEAVMAGAAAGAAPAPSQPPVGTPDEQITTRLDVRPWLDRKRAAMSAHASQMPASSVFLALPDEVFEAVWGEENYIHRSPERPGAGLLASLVAGGSR